MTAYTAAPDSRPSVLRPRSLARIAVAIVLALAAGWFVVRNAAIRLYAGPQPASALLFPPASAAAENQIAFDRVVASNGTADAISRALFRDAAAREPLLPEPYVLAGLDASARGDFNRARRLMQEVRRRDPRVTVARFWLLDDYLRSGNYAAALEEVSPVLALQAQPGAHDAIIALVTALIDVPEARPALVARLRQSPDWRRTFFAQAIASPRLADSVPALLAAAPYRPDLPASPAEQRDLTNLTIRQQGIAAGYAQWRGLLPPAYMRQASAGSIYDGNFAGWPGSRPFGWRRDENRRRSVRMVKTTAFPEGTALEVGYRSDRRFTLAEQLVPITPGAKRLFVKVRSIGTDDESTGAIGTTISCAEGARRTLAEAALPLAQQAVERHVDFDVPASCPAVRLILRSEADISVDTVDAQLTGLRIVSR